MSDLIKLAKILRDKLGWSTIPIRSAGSYEDRKKPTIKWAEFQDRYMTDEEIEKHFEGVSNIALVTGEISGVDVLDFDSYKKQFSNIEIVSDVISKTPSGGQHLYFKHTQGLRPSVNEKLAIDVRSSGSYVLIPPSSNIGGIYEWIKKPTKEILENLKQLPTEVIASVIPQQNGESFNLADYQNISKGARDDSLLKVACHFLNHFENDQALALIKATNNQYDPPLHERDVIKIFNSARKFIANNPKTTQQPTQTRSTVTRYSENFEYRKFTNFDLVKTGLTKLDEAFSFIPGFYLVCSAPGIGKSFFGLWLIKQFAITSNKPSVFFSAEMPEELTRKRVLQQWSNLSQEEFNNGGNTRNAEKLLSSGKMIFDPWGQEDGSYMTPENFEKDFKEYYKEGIRIFIFDHFHEIPNTTSMDSGMKVTEIWGAMFARLAKTYPDVWMIVLAQPNAMAYSKKVIRKQDFYGSKAAVQKADIFISLNREAEIDPKTKELILDQENREVVFWVDKNRKDGRQFYGVKLYFGKDANFYSDEEDFYYQKNNQQTPGLQTENIRKPINQLTTDEFYKLRSVGKIIVDGDKSRYAN